jgi:hypothetical protein
VIEKADIVVAIFDRLDLALDKIIQLGKIVCDVLGDFKQRHAASPLSSAQKVG